MKRLLLVLLAICLLTGCAEKKEKETKAQPEESAGWYDENNQLEMDTVGAVRSYSLQTGTVTDVLLIGDNVLLVEQADATKLTVMEREEGIILAQTTLPKNATGLQSVNNAVAYYLPEEKEAVYLDQSLQPFNKVKLPDTAEGTPVFSPDCTQIYYCAGQDIKSFDVNMGVSRPVRSHPCKSQTLTGIHFDGKVLQCSLETDEDPAGVCYISAETGELLSRDKNISLLVSERDRYIAFRMDGVVQQYVCGTLEGDPASLILPEYVTAVPMIQSKGLLTYHVNGMGATELHYYDTESGLKTGFVSLVGIGTIVDTIDDSAGVWLLTDTEDGQVLHYWSLNLSPVLDENVYAGPLYTAENPDKDGLKACKERAEEIAEPHYVYIQIWDNALRSPEGYEVTGEYQTEAIDAVLDQLEQTLARYPDRFFYKCTSGILRINIVRSISTGAASLQFRGTTDPYIVLTVDCNVQEEFDKAMGYVVNSRVMAKSPLFDNWSDLNPEGFVYGETIDDAYISEEGQAFADEASMKSVTDDRAILFAEAMKADNGQMFQSPVMQTKLNQLCLGIRDAWGWEEKSDVFPWEQYLATPIAPQ